MDAALSPAETTFGDLLRRHRQASGLTQEELAARTGLSVRGLSDLERGVRAIPRKDTLQLLIAALDLGGPERAALAAAARRRPAPPPRRLANDPDAPGLPALLTPFVGRADEVAAVRTLLLRDDVRLLTLTGPGGVGKTRLALRVAQEIGGSFADGVRFIDLAAIREPAIVTTTIAQHFGLREMGGRPLAERLAAVLRDKQLLLLLDNFEQVVAAAPQVVALLAGCPELSILVTSRSMLHISGERAFPVPPLALPDPAQSQSIMQVAASEAVRLFVDRAQAVSPHFALDDVNAPTVAAICRRLDGLPLAITLAAARIGHLPPSALLERLEPRLPLLTGGPHDQPDRLRTMRNAVAWSHDLLSAHEQRLFRRLAVFSGGFTLEAAEYVGGDACGLGGDGFALGGVGPTGLRGEEENEGLPSSSSLLSAASPPKPEGRLPLRSAGPPPPKALRPTPPKRSDPPSVLDLLSSLVDRSLVWHDPHAASPRYRMLETIREYGLERLTASGEAEIVRQRHAAWCLALAERSHDALPGPEQRTWLERTDAEHDNIREALSWLLERDEAEMAQRLTASLYRFWYVRGYLSEGRDWAERALQGTRTTPLAVREGALLAAGWMSWAQGAYAQAIVHLHESLGAFCTLGHSSGVAESHYVLGMVEKDRDEYEQATAHLMEALGLFRSLGATFWVGFVLNALGIVAYEQGDVDRARAWFGEALIRLRTVGETHGIAYALTNLGRMALAVGDTGQAAAYFRESLALRHKHGDQMSVAGCLRGLAAIAAASGKFTEAASLLGATEALRERIGLPQPRYHSRSAQTVDDCRAALGEVQFSICWQAGRQLPLERAVEMAIAVARGDSW